MNRYVLSLAATAAITAAAPPAQAQGRELTPAKPQAGAEPASAIVLRALQRVFGAEPAQPAAAPLWRAIEMRSPAVKPGPTCGLLVTPPAARLDPKFDRLSLERPRHLGMRTVPVLCR